MLLKEEMRRVLAYLKWKSSWWLGLKGKCVVGDKVLAEGLGAIAVKQSDHQLALHDMFRATWQDPLGELSPSDLLVNGEGDGLEIPESEDDDDVDDEEVEDDISGLNDGVVEETD
ncbi:hypothetical protein BJ165DRAFT_1359063 [Panaeolus papilionaceus]|nr:hypothetical protein BJ165DRAFT_1359063 [Panaeolus papilionaceus]